MIRYTLLCDQDHQFDSWFDNSKAYDKLERQGLIECPHCGSAKIRKSLMSPQISTSRSKKAGEQQRAETAVATSTEPRLQQLQQEAVELARTIRAHVKENADNVGDQFAKEARKIHHEEAEPRNIYGKATLSEATQMAEEKASTSPPSPTSRRTRIKREKGGGPPIRYGRKTDRQPSTICKQLKALMNKICIRSREEFNRLLVRLCFIQTR